MLWHDPTRVRMARQHWGLVTLVGLVGCLDPGRFACSEASECDLAMGSMCLDGTCAYVDDSCESGYRFDERPFTEGACVPVTTSGGSTTTGPSTDPSTTSSDAPGSSTTSPPTSNSSESTEGSDSTTDEPSTCSVEPCPCAIDVAAGTDHNCAIRTDGSVVCWGRNNSGQLGTGTGTNPIPWPQVVDLPVRAVQVAAGVERSCAVTEDIKVWCWGRSWGGSITPGLANGITSPVEVTGVSDLTHVRLGYRFTCGWASDASVHCWGINDFGQLLADGEGNALYASGPFEFMPDDIVLGRSHGCFVGGTAVHCWGNNAQGQLGSPMATAYESAPIAVQAPFVGASRIAAGRNHTCAVGDDGLVYCWGDNTVSQITADTTNLVEPPTAIAWDGLASVELLAAGESTTCAWLDDGSLYCWGGDRGGNWGIDIAYDELVFPPRRSDVADELPEPPVQMTMGVGHICVRSASERLWCWGRDNWQQLGGIDPPPGRTIAEIDLECAR